MKINTKSPLIVLLILFIIIVHLSCVKDSDLLSDYVLADSLEKSNGNNVVDDKFIISLNNNMILDVLKNDLYIEQDSVKIKKTSSASYGEIIINNNNTLTYIPNTVEISSTTEQEIVDTFTYTTEVVNEDQSATTEEGAVTVVIDQETDNDIAETDNDKNCFTSGGKAGDEGLKTWCWDDLETEINGLTDQAFIDNRRLFTSVHYYNPAENYKPVQVRNSRIYFKVNPHSAVPNGSKDPYNYRSEVRDAPSDVNHPVGTEQWWGFDYRFEDDYVPDELPWIMWQTHGSFSNPSNPMTSLQIAPTNFAGNRNSRGELVVSNAAISTGNATFKPIGIIPQAGQTLNIVIHLVWGDNNTGLYQVWIDGVKVYDEQERTVYVEQPQGGYWKMGIYKWRWKDQTNVNSSASLGISELNTSIGSLKVIKKSPSNSSYLADEYNTVKPIK